MTDHYENILDALTNENAMNESIPEAVVEAVRDMQAWIQERRK